MLLAVLAFTTAVWASFVQPPYDNAKSPGLSLPAAYQTAEAALGADTNRFHCVGANITTDFGAPRWSFTFYTTNSPPGWKCLTVDFAGKVQEDNGFR